MGYEDKIVELALQAEEQSCFDDRIKLLKQAIKIADAHNDNAKGYDLRIFLISAEQITNHSRESFPAFTWLLSVYDENPEAFSSEDILMIYRWLAYNCFNNLEVSPDQLDNITEDFRRRLLEQGYGEREYYNVKINHSLFKGDKISARKYLDAREEIPIDNMSFEGLDLLVRIFVEISEGDFDNAIFHTKQFVAQQPIHHLSKSMVYSGFVYHSLVEGCGKIADEYFEKAIADFSCQTMYPYHMYELSLLMYYMSRYRKEAAWKYFEEFANWELRADDIYRFHFSTSLLHLFMGEGTRLIEGISSEQPYYNSDNIYKLEDLYTHYKNISLNLANRFDERGDTNDFKETIEKVLYNI